MGGQCDAWAIHLNRSGDDTEKKIPEVPHAVMKPTNQSMLAPQLDTTKKWSKLIDAFFVFARAT